MAPNLDSYVDVAERLVKFREQFPEGSLQFEWSWQELPDGRVWLVGKAFAYRNANDDRPAMGHAWEEYPGKTNFTRGSELMNLETSCWGRAIAGLGIETRRGVATKQEVEAAQARNGADQWATKPTTSAQPLPDKAQGRAFIFAPDSEATQKQTNAILARARKVGVKREEVRKFMSLMLEIPIDEETRITMRMASDLLDMRDEQWFETAVAGGFGGVPELPSEQA